MVLSYWLGKIAIIPLILILHQFFFSSITIFQNPRTGRAEFVELHGGKIENICMQLIELITIIHYYYYWHHAVIASWLHRSEALISVVKQKKVSTACFKLAAVYYKDFLLVACWCYLCCWTALIVSTVFGSRTFCNEIAWGIIMKIGVNMHACFGAVLF